MKTFGFLKIDTYFCTPLMTVRQAKVAQLVERDLAKVEVAGSNPVFRSFLFDMFDWIKRRNGGMVDTQDLKSCDLRVVWVQVPLLVLLLKYLFFVKNNETLNNSILNHLEFLYLVSR